MEPATLFTIVAALYGAVAVGLLVQLRRNHGRTFDDDFTVRDRRLAASVAFYFGVPASVLLHELGHAVAIWGLGGHVADFQYMFYWGYVAPERGHPFRPWEEAFVAASGNVLSLAIGFGILWWTVRHPINAAWNFARFELARLILLLELLIYPVLSLLLNAWDFATIRRSLNGIATHMGDVVMVAYGGLAAVVWWRWQHVWRHRYLWLATRLFDRRQGAERRIKETPDDEDALRELARVYLSADRAGEALETLQRVLAHHPNEPETHFLAGLACLRSGRMLEASEHLRTAGGTLEDDDREHDQAELYFEIMLGLATARLGLADPEGALMTAEAAHRERPAEPRALLLHADALTAAGHRDEARNHLEDALQGARGAFAQEIKRRLKAL